MHFSFSSLYKHKVAKIASISFSFSNTLSTSAYFICPYLWLFILFKSIVANAFSSAVLSKLTGSLYSSLADYKALPHDIVVIKRDYIPPALTPPDLLTREEF